MSDQIKFCFIKAFPTLEKGLLSLLRTSRSQLKKSNLTKKYLAKNVEIKSEFSLPIDVINHLKINPCYDGPKVEIVFEDEHFIFFSKPNSYHSHPLKYSEQDNILSALRSSKDHSKLLDVNSSQYDRGLLYRLDFGTSGLIGYAKTDKIYSFIRENFKEVVKQKNYLAVVDGKWGEKRHLTHYLRSSSKKGSLIKSFDSQTENTKRADIDVKEIGYSQSKDVSLVLVSLDQGQRHQIRAQLSCAGYPIVGDSLYNQNTNTESYNRMYLHCFEYVLDYNSKEIVITDDSFRKELLLFDF